MPDHFGERRTDKEDFLGVGYIMYPCKRRSSYVVFLELIESVAQGSWILLEIYLKFAYMRLVGNDLQEMNKMVSLCCP